MRALLASILVLGVLATAAAADVAKAIVDPYLRIHAALAADQLDHVKADASAIAGEAAKGGPEVKAVETAARELEKAGDVKAVRAAFAKLSDALIAYARRTKSTLGPDTFVAYCPMVKQSWVQKGTKIQNPYFGSQMLECGEFKK